MRRHQFCIAISIRIYVSTGCCGGSDDTRVEVDWRRSIMHAIPSVTQQNPAFDSLNHTENNCISLVGRVMIVTVR